MIILQCVYNGDVGETISAKLQPIVTSESIVTPKKNGHWHLEIPAGPAGQYRLAQLDDYSHLSRSAFRWHPPLSMEIRARASDQTIPGTWGFGFWNDPFSLSLGMGGGTRRLPCLPNALWFFFASPQNHLSIYDHLPSNGALAATFASASLSSVLLALGSPLLPLMVFRSTARLLRRIARRWISQDSTSINVDVVQWHLYKLIWGDEVITFELDGQTVMQTRITPRGPLGFLVWVDNQYAALPADGKFSYGTLEHSEPTWIEIMDLNVISI